MKKRALTFLILLALALTACAPAGNQPSGEDELTVVATTYPVYLFVRAVTDGVEGIRVERLNTGETSCLHDYTLSVNDMKLLERADVIALSGAGLEDFLEDALASSDAPVIDCSAGVELLENLSHHHDEDDHDHDGHDHGHFDPHYWMDLRNGAKAVETIAGALSELDPDHGEDYQGNLLDAVVLLEAWDSSLRDLMNGEMEIKIPGLITFHDGFQYFCHAYGLPLLHSIEEEAGSEASAHEIVEVTELVRAHTIPVIFTEVSGSDATAKAISRETGCTVAQLSMVMDGPDGELSNYFDAMLNNMAAVINGFAGEQVVEIG